MSYLLTVVLPIVVIICLFIVVYRFVTKAFDDKKEDKIAHAVPYITDHGTILKKRYTHWGDFNNTYYLSFQSDSGVVNEFEIDGNDYNLILEGDTGIITTQGSRFIGFELD